MDIESLVNKAQNADKKALEELLKRIQDNIYYLSLRMLHNKDDAQDATQEILILVMTKLSTFEFKSAFRTWVYKVASNYLLSSKKVKAKELGLNFNMFKQDLESDFDNSEEMKSDPYYQLMLNEVRVSCTMAMLLCLDQKHRLAYILGYIFELEQSEGSEILGINKDTYRQQLSRARKKVEEFTQESCGLVNKKAQCSCDKKIQCSIKRGRINTSNLYLANSCEDSYDKVKQNLEITKTDLKSIFLQKSVPLYQSPESFVHLVEELVG